MNEASLVQRAYDYICESMVNGDPGHDKWHVYRVWRLAQQICLEEPSTNKLVVELGAVLHDIGDWKFHGEGEGVRKTRLWLSSQGVDEEIIASVEAIVRDISFKGALVEEPILSLEGKIVQDADRLDAIGAIGVARCFTYGGYKRRVLHDPSLRPVLHTSADAYHHANGTAVNHFYEKLLLLKERLHTRAARRIAEQRHQFMTSYLDQFLAEWEGKR